MNASAQGFGLKVSAGFHGMGGDLAGDRPGELGLSSGAGFEAVGSWAWSGGLELGLGTGIGFPGRSASSSSAELVTVFAEPIYRFNTGASRAPHVHPFFGGRIGYARLGLPDGGPSRNGLQVGTLGGLEYWLTDRVGLVGAGVVDFFSFGRVESVPGTDVDGSRFGLQGGLKVRFH